MISGPSTFDETWPIQTIMDIAGKPQYGWTTRAHRGEGVKLLRTTDITSGAIDWNSVPVCEEPPADLEKYRLRPGDIVVSRAGSVGFSALIDSSCPDNAVFASYLMRIHPNHSLVRAEFLYQYMKSSYYWQQVGDASVGIGLANVNGSKLAAMTIPVPPIAEQERLIALVEQLDLQRMNAALRLRKSIRAIDRFRFALLVTAFSGALTANWRAKTTSAQPIGTPSFRLPLKQAPGRGKAEDLRLEPLAEGPESWRQAPLSQCVDVLDFQRKPVNSTARAKRLGNVPYYGATGQVGWIDDFLFNEELVLLGEDGAPFLDKSRPLAYIINGKAWVNNHAHVLRARTGVTSSRYLKYFLDWFDYTDYVQGSTRDKLTQGAMNSMPFLLPPLGEQAEIVRSIDELLAAANAIRERVDAAERQLLRTGQAVLRKVFAGELDSNQLSSPSAETATESRRSA